MRADVHHRIEKATGARAAGFQPLSGGCVGDVYKASLSNGDDIVIKLGDDGSGLALEGDMLRDLKRLSDLPVPDVLAADDTCLIMTCLPGGGNLSTRAQEHAADLVAQLHGTTHRQFGYDYDTVIGGLHQPNPWTENWIDFFRSQRLMAMGRTAHSSGRLPKPVLARLENFCGSLDKWIGEPVAASLIHGDMWSGNVLALENRISGFIDPAIYFADPEIELAFTTLFNTFGDAFFHRYQEHRPLDPGFFEERRDIYNLYPLLVHVQLFGGGYVGSVEGTLTRFGF